MRCRYQNSVVLDEGEEPKFQSVSLEHAAVAGSISTNVPEVTFCVLMRKWTYYGYGCVHVFTCMCMYACVRASERGCVWVGGCTC